MGVDYDGVGGVGVAVEDHTESLIAQGCFTKEEWKSDPHECMEKVGQPFGVAGSAYAGEENFYWLVDGETLGEINKNAGAFCRKLENWGISIAVDDLAVISDLHMW